MKQKLIYLMLAAFLVSACGSNMAIETPTPTPLLHVRLPMGYIPNVQYAPFYVAVDKGYFAKIGVEIEFDYSFETDGVALVGANELQFAVVSGEQVLLARAQGLPVVYVMAWWQEYPVAITALAESGIQTLADLKGKRIGVPGLFGASYIGLRALLEAGGLAEEDVTIDSIGFNQVEVLAAGRADAVVVYANNEPLQLLKQGYQVNTLRVADYVHLTSNGLISNQTTIQKDPNLIRSMLLALLKGISYTIENPEEAFEICKKYVEGLEQADRTLQLDILLTSLEFWKAEELGYSDPEAWENMQAVLLNMGMFEQPLDLSQAFTNQFLPDE